MNRRLLPQKLQIAFVVVPAIIVTLVSLYGLLTLAIDQAVESEPGSVLYRFRGPALELRSSLTLNPEQLEMIELVPQDGGGVSPPSVPEEVSGDRPFKDRQKFSIIDYEHSLLFVDGSALPGTDAEEDAGIGLEAVQAQLESSGRRGSGFRVVDEYVVDANGDDSIVEDWDNDEDIYGPVRPDFDGAGDNNNDNNDAVDDVVIGDGGTESGSGPGYGRGGHVDDDHGNDNDDVYDGGDDHSNDGDDSDWDDDGANDNDGGDHHDDGDDNHDNNAGEDNHEDQDNNDGDHNDDGDDDHGDDNGGDDNGDDDSGDDDSGDHDDDGDDEDDSDDEDEKEDKDSDKSDELNGFMLANAR